MSSPPKITAEWIVRAQLIIRKPNENNQSKNTKITTNQEIDEKYSIEQRPIAVERTLFDNENPIKVIYKWCSNDSSNHGENGSIVETIVSTPNELTLNASSKDSGSFRSAGVTSSDSGICTSKPATKTNSLNQNCNNSSKLQSTCNIILTACTNIIPEQTELAENFSTSIYTLFPDNEV